MFDYINKYIEKIHVWFINKYKIKPSGYCPVQAEGTLPTGEYYYFRSRHSTWSIRIAKTEKEIWEKDKNWVYSEQKYIGHEGGWISELEAVKNINKAVKLYYLGVNFKVANP